MIAAAVWLAYSSRGWSCDDCSERAGLRALRGDCGGPFQKGLPHLDPEGSIYGYRIAPDSDPDWGEQLFTACPVAAVAEMDPLFRIHRGLRVGVGLRDIIPSPTDALIDGLGVIDRQTTRAQTRAAEASHG